MDDPTHKASAPSLEPFGEEIAAGVAHLLERGGCILRGYCAHWMVKRGDRFVYELLKSERQEVFGTSQKTAFAAWLAMQSPRSLDDHVRPATRDTIQVITHELLRKSVAGNAGVNDPTPYGTALGSQVAAALDRGVTIVYSHRDYCGMGLSRDGRGYLYGTVVDGHLVDETVFATRDALVAWLAQQSDATLAGREMEEPFLWDNQRIDRARLREAIAATAPE